MIIVTGCALLPACGTDKSKDIPSGQVSSKIIHNPRSADGMNAGEAAKAPKLVFADTAFDFGTMNEGEKVEHEFTFKNGGKSPLLVTGAETSCGCTTPSFTHEPVLPGGTGTMKVAFASAGKHGQQMKAITVSSNAFPATQVLIITADVREQK